MTIDCFHFAPSNKKARYIIGLIFLLCWCFACTDLFAQRSSFKNYTLEDGLPQSQIYDIHQDSRGYLWFATYGGGAARFDGQKFISLSDVSGVQHHRVVFDILEDSKGYLWFATRKGVICYDGKQAITFTTKDGLPNNRVHHITEDAAGNIWLSTAAGAARFDGQYFAIYTSENGLPDSHVEMITSDNKGGLWFGTQAGVGRMNDIAEGRIISVPELKNLYVQEIKSDSDGTVWLGSRQGLIKFDGHEYKTFGTKDGLPSAIIHAIHEDESGKLWIGTQRGLAYFEHGSIQTLTSQLFDDDPIWSLGGDREGNLWVGTSGKGVFMNSPSPFFHISPEDGLSDAIVWNFTEEEDGTMWIATMNGLTRLKDGEMSIFTTDDGLLVNEVRALHIDKNGRKWVGSTQGLQLFDGQTFIEPAGVREYQDKIRSIYEDESGLWFVTDSGVIHFDEISYSFTPFQDIGARPNGMVRDLNGDLWFVTIDGITRFDGQSYSRYHGRDGLTHPAGLSIGLGPLGNVWVGTYGGITMIEPSKNGQLAKFKSITRDDGMVDDVIYFILFDEEDYLWTCTNSGLYRLDVMNFLETGEKQIKVYDKASGFIGQECNTQAGFQDQHGDLWFGTVKGVTRYARDLEKKDLLPPKLHLVGLNLFYENPDWLEFSDSLVTWTGIPQNMELPHSQNHLTFKFTGLSYQAPDKVKYRHKLEGFDEDWSPIIARREATYANLPPGDYTFKVEASNSDGIWTTSPIAYSFSITTPYWKTLWFLFLCFNSVFFGVFIIVRLRTRSFEQQQKILEETVALRTNDLLKINTELAQTNKDLVDAREAALAAARAKSEFLANMSHEIRTPLNGIIGFTGLMLDSNLESEAQEYLEIIRVSGENLLTIINDILDFSKIEAGKVTLEEQPFSMHTCVEEALDLLAARASDKSLELTHLIDEKVPQTVIGDVTRLRQILVNLLSNAVKFSESGEVSVEATVIEKEIEGGSEEATPAALIHVKVIDEGIGIPAERIGSLFESFEQVDASTTRKYGGTGLGLSISKRLCELMGGEMWVESVVGEGSTFHFTIRAGMPPDSQQQNRYQDPQQLLKGKRVLVVDDHNTNLRMMKSQFMDWRVQATCFQSGHEAIEFLSRNPSFDVLVIDDDMPEMSGEEFINQLSQMPSVQEIPRIMLTSLTSRSNNQSRSLFSHTTNKPIKRVSLFNALIFALGISVNRDEENTSSVLDKSFARRHPMRILVAEDNVVNQKVIVKILNRLGYRVDIAGNGQEVLDSLKMRSYDLVLMDLHMPEMDGLEATRQIQRLLPANKRPAILAMTAAVLEEDRQRCSDAGMEAFISKPVKMEMLIKELVSVSQNLGRSIESNSVPSRV